MKHRFPKKVVFRLLCLFLLCLFLSIIGLTADSNLARAAPLFWPKSWPNQWWVKKNLNGTYGDPNWENWPNKFRLESKKVDGVVYTVKAKCIQVGGTPPPIDQKCIWEADDGIFYCGDNQPLEPYEEVVTNTPPAPTDTPTLTFTPTNTSTPTNTPLPTYTSTLTNTPVAGQCLSCEIKEVFYDQMKVKINCYGQGMQWQVIKVGDPDNPISFGGVAGEPFKNVVHPFDFETLYEGQFQGELGDWSNSTACQYKVPPPSTPTPTKKPKRTAPPIETEGGPGGPPVGNQAAAVVEAALATLDASESFQQAATTPAGLSVISLWSILVVAIAATVIPLLFRLLRRPK